MSRKIIHWLDDDKKYLCNKNLSVVLERTIYPPKNKNTRMDELDKITCKNCIKKMVYKYPFVVPKGVFLSGRKVILPEGVEYMNGGVLWYDAKKGFGSILGADGNTYFVHKSSLPFWNPFLEADDLVEFRIEENKKGPVAKDIKVIGIIA